MENESVNSLQFNEIKYTLEVFKKFEGIDHDKIYEVLSKFKNKKLKINNISIEKYEDMKEYLDFEQFYLSRTAKCLYKIEHLSIRIMKWMAHYDRYYENIN